MDTLTVPGRSPQERRLLSAADHVYKRADAANAEPTDENLLALADAFNALKDKEAAAATTAGVDERYVKDVVGRAWRACYEVLRMAAQLVDPPGFDSEPEDI